MFAHVGDGNVEIADGGREVKHKVSWILSLREEVHDGKALDQILHAADEWDFQ